MVALRMLTPDTSLWEVMAGLLDLVGGGVAVVLVAAAFALIVGAVMWALGHSWGSSRVADTGRAGVWGAWVRAGVAPARRGWVGWVMDTIAAAG